MTFLRACSRSKSYLIYFTLSLIWSQKKIGEEFPDIITVGSFGKTWEDRDLKFIKLDARKDRNKDKASSLSETDTTSSSAQEKSGSMSSSSDDDFLKSLGADVHNVYVQLDQEVSSIKQSLKKNI